MLIATRSLLLSAAVLVFPSIATSTDLDGSAGFIEVNAGLLSVTLENVPLSDVLRTLGAQAGARVSIQGNLGSVQPQVFWGIPLDEGIKRLVQNSNADLVMIYSHDKTKQTYLKEIRAYERTGNSRTFRPAQPHISAEAPPPIPVPVGW